MRVLKIAAIVLGVFVVAAVAIVAGVLTVGGGSVVAWAVEHPISSYIGRKLTVKGPVSVDWGSPTRIVLHDVAVANARWGTAPNMFTADSLTVAFDPSSVVSGAEKVPLVSLQHAKLLLETSPKGERNWSFLSKLSSSSRRSGLPILNKVAVNDSEIVFRNGTTGAKDELSVKHAEFDAPDPNGPAKLAFDGALKGEPLHLAGTVGPLAQLRSPGKPYPVDLEGSFGDSTFRVEGQMTKPLSFSGADLRVSFVGKGLKRLAGALDLPLPPLPDFRATGELTGGSGVWTLKALSAKLGSSDLEGGISIDVRGKLPYLRANLTSSYVDLADFTGFLGTKPAHSSAAVPNAVGDNRIISDRPIAVEKLQMVNADVGFEAGRIKGSKGLPLDRVSASLHLEDGVLTVRPLDFALADGTVDFGMSIDANQPEPRLQLDLDIRHIDLRKLVQSTGVSPTIKETAGVAGGFVHFTSSGRSLRDFLGRMDGKAALFMERGRLSQLLQEAANLDVLEALGVLASGDRELPVNCFVGSFDLAHGIATAHSLVLDTTDTLVVGRGNFNFGGETIYLDLDPYDKTPTLFTLHTPIEVRGTFAKPSIGLSPTGIEKKVAAAVVLGFLLPPVGELLPFVDLGLGKDNACSQVFSSLRQATR